MKQETITRIKLTASAGYVLTNGTEYTLERFLFEGEDPKNWHEITEEEYAKIQAVIDERNNVEGEV